MLMNKKILILFLMFLTLSAVRGQEKFFPATDNNTPFYLGEQQGKNDQMGENDVPKFTIDNKILHITGLDKGMQVDVYSVLGTKVLSFVHIGNDVHLNLKKGIYILRSGKYSQKIIL